MGLAQVVVPDPGAPRTAAEINTILSGIASASSGVVRSRFRERGLDAVVMGTGLAGRRPFAPIGTNSQTLATPYAGWTLVTLGATPLQSGAWSLAANEVAWLFGSVEAIHVPGGSNAYTIGSTLSVRLAINVGAGLVELGASQLSWRSRGSSAGAHPDAQSFLAFGELVGPATVTDLQLQVLEAGGGNVNLQSGSLFGNVYTRSRA